MTAAPSISLIVCAHSDKRRDQLRAALESIRAQDRPALETIVVIDHNPSLQELVSAAFADLLVAPNRGPKGLSAARNTGVRCAAGEIVAFLDDDARASSGWLARMQSHYASPAVIAVGGRVDPVWPEGRPRWFPREFDWVVGCSYRGQPEQLAAVRNLIGCNMSFRRSVFDAIGCFREGLGREGGNAFGCEETEFCIRAGQAFPQSLIIYDPEMVVSHQVGPERTQWQYFRARCLAEGRSKTMVVRNVGARWGLASEARYATRVLPAGVLRGFGDALLKFDVGGLGRAAAILAGLGYVSWGYQSETRIERARARSRRKEFAPIRIVDLDLSHPLPELQARDPHKGVTYGGALCLVRSGGRPVGIVEVPLNGTNVPATALEPLLRQHVGGLPGPRISPTVLPGPAPFVSVVVATRDRPASLAICLESLLSQDYPNFEVVVVDSAPASSDTADLVLGRYVPARRVRYLRENRPGLGQAHNRGIADVTAPLIAFTDDDVVVDPHWLSALSSGFGASSNVGCVTGLILPAELETRAQYWTERHGGFGKGFEQRIYDIKANRLPGRMFPYAAGVFGSGANMAFTRDALRRIGGFDPALGAGTLARGGDDLAAFVSLIRAGYQLVYEPRAVLWHHHRREENGMRRQAFGYGVGLGAYLTKFAIEDPATLLHFARALPAAAMHLLGSNSPKNRRLPEDYPTAFVWRERLGILAGVPAYLRSRAALRRPPEHQAPRHLVSRVLSR